MATSKGRRAGSTARAAGFVNAGCESETTITSVTATQSVASHAPNIADIKAHLFTLFAPEFVKDYPNAWIEVAFTKPNGKLNRAKLFSAFDLKAAADFAFAKNRARFNIYVGAALRQGERPPSGRATKKNFLAAAFAWVEYDKAGDRERVADICKAEQLEPAMRNGTGTTPNPRDHLYFRNATPIKEHAELEAANEALQQLLGTDSVSNCDRVLRLAGTVSYPSADKIARGYVTELTTLKIAGDPPSYSVDALCSLRKVRAAPAQAPATASASSSKPTNAFLQYPAAIGVTLGLDDDELAALLDRHPNGTGTNWHEDMLAATWEMLVRGYDLFAIHRTIAASCKDGVLDKDIGPLIDKKYAEFQQAEREADIGKPAKPKARAIVATPYVWKDPSTIPLREWLYGRQFIRKFVSATVAPGGIGKSSLEIAEVLAMVSGKTLLGVAPDELLRVWFYNLEDPREEIERRVQAAAIQFNLTADDIGDRMYLDCGRDQPLVIAMTLRNNTVINRPVVDAIVAEIIARKIDVLIVDPFVSCHKVQENDNSAYDMIVKEWGRVADLGNCAIELVHHARKSSGNDTEITVESSRGGKSLTDACRMVRTINPMTKDEATSAGVENHRFYFRTFGSKLNLAPPPDKSDWFKLVSVDLGNGPASMAGTGGDSVGVVTKWEWPDHLDGVTGRDFDAVAAVIRSGQWRESSQATAWVGHAVARAMKLDVNSKAHKAKIKTLLKVWLASGALVVVNGTSEDRKPAKFIEVRDETEE